MILVPDFYHVHYLGCSIRGKGNPHALYILWACICTIKLQNVFIESVIHGKIRYYAALSN